MIDSERSPHSVVIGSGGLLGSAITRKLGLASGPTGVDWETVAVAGSQLHQIAGTLLSERPADHWSLYWCAGTGFVGAGADALRRETEMLRAFLDTLSPIGPTGTVCFASSAGAIHAGGPNPSSENSPPSPASRYGIEKLRQEDLIRSWCALSGARAVISRLSNLYGPGQNLNKPQGLISGLVRASLLSRPLTIFVPLETTRDYLFVDDAAEALTTFRRLVASSLPAGATITKIVSSGRLTSIGTIVAEVGRIRKKRPPIVFASKPASALQPRTVAFRSVITPDVVPLARTTIPDGISAVMRGHLAAVGEGRLQ